MRRATTAILALLAVLLAVIIAVNSPLPVINAQYGDIILHFAADRAWSLFPGDCVTLEWRVDGIESLHIEGRGEIGWGKKAFCPQVNNSAARFEVRSPDGLYRKFKLRIHFLPDLLLYLAGFFGVIGSLGLAVYCLRANQPQSRLPWRGLLIGAALLIVLGAAIWLAPVNLPLIDYADEQVRLRYWAKKSSLLFPRECLAAHWSVVGAESLSFNGDDVFAIDDRHSQGRYCIEFGGAPTLTLQTADGATSSHSLPVDMLLPGAGESAFIAFQTLGLALAGVVFLPLLVQAAQAAWRARKWRDLCALAGCLAITLLLYLPFGFDAAAHWEVWVNGASAQGLSGVKHRGEEVSRFFALMPHILATLLDSDSFIGFNLVHFALHFGKMAAFYLILRQLGARALLAFLTAVLCFAYPVNSGLMSLRSLPLNHSVFWLLVGLCLLLDWLRNPRRHSLLGVLLALLFNVASNESGYALILVLPALWWLRGEYSRRLRLAATVLWYLPAVFKVAWLLLLELTSRPAYTQGGLSVGENGLGAAADTLGWVYQLTFLDGWREAITSLADNYWLLPTLLGLALVAGLARTLARDDAPAQPATYRQIGGVLLGGLLLIIAAVGVLMWFDIYRDDAWRMFFYVPMGAAVTIICLLRLLVAKIRDQRARDYVLIALCLLLLLPALSRLFVQHAVTIAAADRKARILHGIVSLAPVPHPQTQLLVMTSMSLKTLRERGIWELAEGATIDSALWLVYEERAPDGSTFCVSVSRCGRVARDDMLLFATNHRASLQKTLMLHVDEALQVTLIDDPAAWLGWDIDDDYDASRLYTADAPLPPRAESMLAPALRRQ
ncbi:MAG: hypothetical protein OXG92_11530 [Chloroflexi bacterium]|nr:hypothetical protein [Chloroflexota bacterium]MCY3582375.1 hypothetical protein [Chloroflexota bacterium]MCY3717085.1 hypothetical protein [Chloroflexota bacterium]MDE2650789.1 hypothetical protein [Chloroflexota bacterium]MXX50757.1 hypothetical protein [Chloroflexota bacterium]